MDIKWYKKPEMIIALSALIASLVATIVSIYSAYTDRQYARASVWPRLEIFQNHSGIPPMFSFSVANSGTGPAIIKHAIVSYDDKPIKKWTDIPNIPNVRQSHISSRILPAQQQVVPLQLTGDKTKEFLEHQQKIKITLCYCSIYEECWITNRSNNPIAIESCRAEPALKFTR